MGNPFFWCRKRSWAFFCLAGGAAGPGTSLPVAADPPAGTEAEEPFCLVGGVEASGLGGPVLYSDTDAQQEDRLLAVMLAAASQPGKALEELGQTMSPADWAALMASAAKADLLSQVAHPSPAEVAEFYEEKAAAEPWELPATVALLVITIHPASEASEQAWTRQLGAQEWMTEAQLARLLAHMQAGYPADQVEQAWIRSSEGGYELPVEALPAELVEAFGIPFSASYALPGLVSRPLLAETEGKKLAIQLCVLRRNNPGGALALENNYPLLEQLCWAEKVERTLQQERQKASKRFVLYSTPSCGSGTDSSCAV